MLCEIIGNLLFGLLQKKKVTQIEPVSCGRGREEVLR